MNLFKPKPIEKLVLNFEIEHFAPSFLPLWHDTNMINILYGSRNSTKSHVACAFRVLKSIQETKAKTLMVRKVQSAVHDSLYETTKDIVTYWGLDRYFHFQDHKSRITCLLNGNTFVPMGTYETLGKSGNAKSIKDPTAAIVDEADELTKEEFDKLLFSLRGSPNLKIYLIFNTDKVDEHHWIAKRFFPKDFSSFEKPDGSHLYIPSIQKGVTIMHSTWKNNPYIGLKEIERFEQQELSDPEQYEITGKGMLKANKPKKPCFPKFDKSKHVLERIPFEPKDYVLMVWDFNQLPHHTVALWQFSVDEKNKIFYCNLVEEFCLAGKSVEDVSNEMCSYLKDNNYQNVRVRMRADYSGNIKDDHDMESKITRVIRAFGMKGFDVSDESTSNPSVAATIDFANAIFDSRVKYGEYTIEIRIAKKCTFHVTDFYKTEKDLNGKVLKVKAKHVEFIDGIKVTRSYEPRGHAVDGLRYMVYGNFEYEYEEWRSSRNRKDDFY